MNKIGLRFCIGLALLCAFLSEVKSQEAYPEEQDDDLEEDTNDVKEETKRESPLMDAYSRCLELQRRGFRIACIPATEDNEVEVEKREIVKRQNNWGAYNACLAQQRGGRRIACHRPRQG